MKKLVIIETELIILISKNIFQIYSSSITDSVISWISNCKQLKLVELYDNKTVSPVGYAHLIRQNPELRSVGRCDNFGQVLSALYDEESIYRRYV